MTSIFEVTPLKEGLFRPKEGSFGLQLLQEEQPLEVTGSTAAEPVETEVPVEDAGEQYGKFLGC